MKDDDKTQHLPRTGGTSPADDSPTALYSRDASAQQSDRRLRPDGTEGELDTAVLLKQRFRLLRKLGEGGMGAVYLAQDQRKVEANHQDPHVAIKLLRGQFAQDSRAFVALQRETDKSQTLAHPNIITVYDFDRDGDQFFMTMEALRGSTLDLEIANRQRSVSQSQEMIKALAQGLAYAHQRHIVHSDVKPQNIFITEEGKLKILDFGIARALQDAGGDKEQAGEIAGLTPTYASCQMFERQQPHPADDVYAIGLIAYELLTGGHPFARKKATEARGEKLRPKRIKGLKGYQWKAIAKALEFEREDRWQNAEQFLRQFSGVGRRVRQLTSALLIAVLSFSAYLLFFQPQSGPDLPFSELSPQQQQSVTAALDEARQAQQFGDINGALFYLDKAYSLHPRNTEVMERLDAVLEPLISRMHRADSAGEAIEYLQQLQELRKYESLSQHSALADLERKLRQLAGQ